MNIVVFSASNQPNSPDRQLAFDLGRSIAEKNWTTVNGGGPGLMNAVLHGAKSVGGSTYAVQLERHSRHQSPYADASEASPTLIDRQNMLMAHGDAYVALPGGLGTIFEVFQILALKNAGELPFDTPLVLLSEKFKPIDEHLRHLIDSGYVRPEARHFYQHVQQVSECIDQLNTYFQTRNTRNASTGN